MSDDSFRRLLAQTQSLSSQINAQRGSLNLPGQNQPQNHAQFHPQGGQPSPLWQAQSQAIAQWQQQQQAIAQWQQQQLPQGQGVIGGFAGMPGQNPSPPVSNASDSRSSSQEQDLFMQHVMSMGHIGSMSLDSEMAYAGVEARRPPPAPHPLPATLSLARLRHPLSTRSCLVLVGTDRGRTRPLRQLVVASLLDGEPSTRQVICRRAGAPRRCSLFGREHAKSVGRCRRCVAGSALSGREARSMCGRRSEVIGPPERGVRV